jgi:hypothetical protein
VKGNERWWNIIFEDPSIHWDPDPYDFVIFFPNLTHTHAYISLSSLSFVQFQIPLCIFWKLPRKPSTEAQKQKSKIKFMSIWFQRSWMVCRIAYHTNCERQRMKKREKNIKSEISQMAFDCYLIRDHFFMTFEAHTCIHLHLCASSSF